MKKNQRCYACGQMVGMMRKACVAEGNEDLDPMYYLFIEKISISEYWSIVDKYYGNKVVKKQNYADHIIKWYHIMNSYDAVDEDLDTSISQFCKGMSDALNNIVDDIMQDDLDKIDKAAKEEAKREAEAEAKRKAEKEKEELAKAKRRKEMFDAAVKENRERAAEQERQEMQERQDYIKSRFKQLINNGSPTDIYQLEKVLLGIRGEDNDTDIIDKYCNHFIRKIEKLFNKELNSPTRKNLSCIESILNNGVFQFDFSVKYREKIKLIRAQGNNIPRDNNQSKNDEQKNTIPNNNNTGDKSNNNNNSKTGCLGFGCLIWIIISFIIAGIMALFFK